jgi:hypothetical protein
VDEYVLAGLALNESEALARVKPLYRSLFLCQLISLFFLKLFVLLERPRPDAKRAASLNLAAPLNESKGYTRATNADPFSHNSGFMYMGILGLAGACDRLEPRALAARLADVAQMVRK